MFMQQLVVASALRIPARPGPEAALELAIVKCIYYAYASIDTYPAPLPATLRSFPNLNPDTGISI